MYLKRINIVNFKNHAEAELDFIPGVNCFAGNNGTGKTNLMDAIYYLAFSKSFFNPVDTQNIKHDSPFFVVEGEFERNDKTEKIYCGLKRGEKKQFKRNKKSYDRLSDHIGLLPLVMMSPADTGLIWDGSEVRRKFVDGVIAQFDKTYLDNLLSYQKALLQRNKLLKKFAEERTWNNASMEVWNMQLIKYGEPVFRARSRFLEEFIPVFSKYYDRLGSDREEVTVEYNSKLQEADFSQLLEGSRDRDSRVQHTTAGIHKDDLVFRLNGHSLKKTGSQGQQKSFLTALKLAQFDFMKERKELKPILLLDDIFDKLDKNRVRSLMEMVSDEHFGQVFLTDADKLRVKEIFGTFHTSIRIFELSPEGIKTES